MLQLSILESCFLLSKFFLLSLVQLIYRVLSLSVYTQSSIGDVSTLRTKLQSRRAQLNAEIEKEDKFHQGSRRLVRASSDHKARDQAQLEASFAESKIRALQAELAKINSSLQAYQQER